MDDGFIFRPLKFNFQNFKTCLNNILPSSKLTFENPEIIYENGKKEQVLNFLDVKNNYTRRQLTVREKCPNAEFFLVHIFLYSA